MAASNEEKQGIRIPTAILGLITTLLFQSGVGIWWASTQTTKLDFVVDQVREMKISVDRDRAERFTTKDASDLLKQMADHEARLRELEKRKG